jgi:hypothetical protein
MSVLLSGSGLCVQAATAENPYTPIVSRNVFNLVPIPVHNAADEAADASLPKISPNGIMTIFGKLQVLFKVATPGQQQKELSYTMGEGERQDDIEVQKIDEKAALITFNNHGTIQTLELSTAASGAAPSPAGGMGGGPRATPMFRPGVAQPAGGNSAATSVGNRFGHNRNAPNAGNPPGGANPGVGGTAPNVVNSAAQQPAISPEEQVIMIEAQRMQAIQAGDEAAPLLPTTELTDQVLGKDETNSQGGQTPSVPK